MTLFSLEGTNTIDETLKMEEKKKYLEKVGQHFRRSSDFH